MGEIVGAAVVSHVPPIVMPEALRREMNDGNDFSLVEGLHRLRAECLERLQPDTIVVLDTHWFTTVEHVISAHERRTGKFTSDELPRGMAQVPYDMPGDPDLALMVEALAARRDDTRVLASGDPYLPVHYPTINLLGFLQGEERWVSVGVCQTATPEDFLLFGRLLSQAVEEVDRRVVVLASGGLSHRFWPLMEFADHESASLENIRTPEAREADQKVLRWWEQGDHRQVIDYQPEYRTHAPEGFFGHYMMMVGSIGGKDCVATGLRYSEYESAAGTGQVHMWFERPDGGWTAQD
ncbi:MAG: catechol 1,2-dioxygenase [Acidimicrobiaceae bacterium]|nr:catechol 1,2-dioxygenase [Acidimicrobiaceae bacterium]|tara:strand:- start:227 stop:1111 length:885 start_codon:yes stop_codon:yes gene_type:complete